MLFYLTIFYLFVSSTYSFQDYQNYVVNTIYSEFEDLTDWLLGDDDPYKVDLISTKETSESNLNFSVFDEPSSVVVGFQQKFDDVVRTVRTAYLDVHDDFDEVSEYFMLPTVNLREIQDTLLPDINVTSKYYEIATVVDEFYSQMTDVDFNIRFSVIYDELIPDLSFMYTFCPADCLECDLTSSEVLCRFCCPDLFSNPISFQSVLTENLYSQWLEDTFIGSGFRTVYSMFTGGEEEVNREQLDASSSELRALIKNFEWIQDIGRGVIIANTPQEVDREIILDTEQLCGLYDNSEMRKQRIMGGKVVEKMKKYPWQVSLATGFFGAFYQHRCGAVMLTEWWVLTAAHCLHTLGSSSTLYVLGGFLNMDDRDGAQIRKVYETFSHENFVPDLYEQDIALMRLQSPMKYNPSLLPICLPSARVDYNSHVGTVGILTGWGRQWSSGPLSTQLEMVELPIISNNECMDWYNRSGSRQYIPESTFFCVLDSTKVQRMLVVVIAVGHLS